MTREDRINGLISLDEKINNELLILQNNLEEILKCVSNEEGYAQYLSRISYIQTLFDRASDIIRETSLMDSDLNFFDAMKAKDRIAVNYIRFNKIKNEIERFLNKDRQEEVGSIARVIESVQQIVDESSVAETKADVEEPTQDSFLEESLITDEEAASRRKKLVKRKSDVESSQGKANDSYYQSNQQYYNNDYNSPYSGDYPTEYSKKPVTAADLRDEQYREAEKQAAEQERDRARRQETHEKFIAYQESQRFTEVPSSVQPSQDNTSPFRVPDNASSDSRPEKPVTAADLRDEQYREAEKQAAEQEQIQSRRQETHERFSAFQNERYGSSEPSSERSAFREFSQNKEKVPDNRPSVSYEDNSRGAKSGQDTEQSVTAQPTSQGSRYNLQHPPQHPAYNFTPSGIARVNPSYSSSKNLPGNGSFQGIPLRQNNIVTSDKPSVLSGVQNPSFGKASEKTAPLLKSTQPGKGYKKEQPQIEFTQFGYMPAGLFANTAVNGVLGRKHTTYKSSNSVLQSPVKVNTLTSGQTPVTNKNKISPVLSPKQPDIKSQKEPGNYTQTPVPRKGENNRSHYQEYRRPYEPIGTTGQTKRGNANKTKKAAVKEPGSGLGKKNNHLRSRAIASSYAKAMGGSVARYAGTAVSRGARKLYMMLQEGDDNALRGFETSRYYGMAAVGTAKALANRNVINSKRTARLAAKQEWTHHHRFSKMSGKEISKELNRNLQKNKAAKADIRNLMNKGSALTFDERRELSRKLREHAVSSRQARMAHKYQVVHRQHLTEVEMSKAFEKRANGRRVTTKVIDKELHSQRKLAEKMMTKKFGGLTRLSDKSLAQEIKALKNQGRSLKGQIKALQSQGAALSSLERKKLMQLMKKHQSLNLRLRKLIGLQNSRMALEQKMKFALNARKKIAKNSMSVKNGLFALQRALMSPLYKSDEIGVQGIAKVLNLSTNHYVHLFIKNSLRATWGMTKFGVRVTHLDKLASFAGRGAKNIAKKVVSKSANKALVKTGHTAGKMAEKYAQKKVKTISGQVVKNVLKKPHAAGAKKLFESVARGGARAVSAVKSGIQSLSLLLKGGSLKIIAIVLAILLVIGIIGGVVSSISSTAGSVVLSPDSSEDGKLDLTAYHDIIIDEWDDYENDLNEKAAKDADDASADKVVIDITAFPENVRDILSMMAVRMSQNLNLDKNDDIEPYLRYLTRQLNPYTKEVSTYNCAGCETEDVDGKEVKYCPGHTMITFSVDPMFIGPQEQLDDPIFSADEMANEDQEVTDGGLIGKFEITYYAPTGNPTATGTEPKAGRTIAVDPAVIQLGTHVIIDGHEYVAEDTGGAIKGNIIDIFVDSEDEAIAKGRRENVNVYNVNYVGGDIQSTGKWDGWTEGNIKWCKIIYYMDWEELYVGFDEIGGIADGGDIVVSGDYVWPVTSTSQSSGYGWRIHPIYKTRKFHKGTDLPVPIGTKVYAAADGTITSAHNSSSAGKMIVIQHANNVMTKYFHNSKLYVSVGDKVTAGQLIALSGNTGNSTGPHLHFEFWVNGATVDPRVQYGFK